MSKRATTAFTKLHCDDCKASTLSNAPLDELDAVAFLRRHCGHVVQGTVGNATDEKGAETAFLERKGIDPASRVARVLFRRVLDEYERLLPQIEAE
jgi:hypothetical protein